MNFRHKLKVLTCSLGGGERGFNHSYLELEGGGIIILTVLAAWKRGVIILIVLAAGGKGE